uniref:F-box domain-containing protein n=1 Tax=Strongyloides venezuelensis TaxID=75913 RepID=A0A0K0EVX4_STRVS
MEEKDSINPLNNDVDTTSEKKLTPAQIIADNTEILCLIFGNIINFKDRKSIELTCRKFYEVCNHRSLCSYFPLEEKGRLHFSMEHDEVKAEIIIFGQEMTINIAKEFSFDENNMDIFARFFAKYLRKVNTLNIENMSMKHADFFMNLNCFEKIQQVNINYTTLINGGDAILSKCLTLNPVVLAIYDAIFNNENIENSYQYTLPESIKTVHMDFKSVEWFLTKMEARKVGTLNCLFWKWGYDPVNLLTELNEEGKMSKLITYFKDISYEKDNLETTEHSSAFNKILLENNIGSFLKIKFNLHDLYETYPYLRDVQKNEAVTRYIQNLENSKNRFLAQEGVYLNIKKLKILDESRQRIGCPFFSKEVELMREDISRMKKLSVFEIYFSLFDNPKDFEMLCGALGKIQTTRIHHCKKMNFSSLKVLSYYAGNLKNMSLIDIESETITTDRILSYFKALESLEIIFKDSYDTYLVFNDFIKFNSNEVFITFKWPKVQHLNIICNRPNFKLVRLFNKVIRNTPRKPGQLLVRDIIYYDNPSYQILVRLSKKLHVFDSPLCDGRFELKNL